MIVYGIHQLAVSCVAAEEVAAHEDGAIYTYTSCVVASTVAAKRMAFATGGGVPAAQKTSLVGQVGSSVHSPAARSSDAVARPPGCSMHIFVDIIGRSTFSAKILPFYQR